METDNKQSITADIPEINLSIPLCYNTVNTGSEKCLKFPIDLICKDTDARKSKIDNSR